MIGRVLLAALLAGIAAGLFMGGIPHERLTPLILTAETYEKAGGHDHRVASAADAGMADQGMTSGNDSATERAAGTAEEESWQPRDGWERTAYTTLASVVTGAGFAVLLAGASLL